MTIVSKNAFVTILVTAAFLPSVVANYHYGSSSSQGSYVQFDSCACSNSDLSVTQGTGDNKCSPDTNKEGSQARTWQNLCAGSRGTLATFDDDNTNVNNENINEDNGNNDFFNIPQRVGDPFRRFCQLIGQYPNVRDFLGRGYSPHTVFAPTDAAFNKVNAIVAQIDEQKLLEIHILPEARLTYDLHCGQTVRTINTDNLQKNNQRTKTKCVTGSITEQLGPGNSRAGHKPVIGQPNNIFNAFRFQNQEMFSNLLTNDSGNGGLANNNEGTDQNSFNFLFSKDVVSCNGIIHVIDNVILPGNGGFTGGVAGSATNGYVGGYSNGGGGGYYGSTYRSGHTGGYYGGGKGGVSYGSSHRGGYYGGGGKGTGTGGYYTQSHTVGGYYGSGKGMGKGMGRGMGKGIVGYGGYGHKGGKGYGYGYKGGKGYGGYGQKGAKGYGYGRGRGGGGGYYRRDLENEEGDFDDYDDEEEYVDFLHPDFDERELYDNDEDEEGEDYYDDEDEKGSVHVGRVAAEAKEIEDKSAAAATAEKFQNRKRRLEALLEPNGNIAPVEE